MCALAGCKVNWIKYRLSVLLLPDVIESLSVLLGS